MTWAALPAATQRYTSQLHARAEEGVSVVAWRLAWRLRFAEAHANKVRVLKRAHAVVQQLRVEWDTEQEGAGEKGRGGGTGLVGVRAFGCRD